jgi:hypothetical protein
MMQAVGPEGLGRHRRIAVTANGLEVNGGITVTVYTKNREDEGSAPGTAVGTFASLSAAFHEVACSGLKDLVRFEITFTAGAAGQGVIFRFLVPT